MTDLNALSYRSSVLSRLVGASAALTATIAFVSAIALGITHAA